MWDALRQDVGFGFRMLRRQPGFTAVAIFALALGIGANTAIFSVVDAVLWRPLPYPAADRVMSIAEQRPRESRWFGPVAPADYFDWRRDNQSFAVDGGGHVECGVGRLQPDRRGRARAGYAARGLAGVSRRDRRHAGASAATSCAEEETVGRDRVVLLSDGFWRRRFGARSIGGRPDRLASTATPFEIIGVLPAHFWWPSRPDVVVPLALDDHDRTLRAAHFLDVVGRLRDGVSPEQAREDLRLIGSRLSQAYPAENANHAPNLRPLRDALRRRRSSGAARAAWRGRLRDVHRLRERRDAAARARGEPPEGAVGAACGRRDTLARRPADADREPRRRIRRRRGRVVRGGVGARGVPHHRAGAVRRTCPASPASASTRACWRQRSPCRPSPA